jgi:pimeloyl-ACP methyl ester carboxylesterase
VLKVVGGLLVVALAFGIGWAWPILVRPPLVLGQDAITDAASAAVVPTLEDAGGRTIVARPPTGTDERDVLVVLYPGGLVRPQGYEWLARTLAARGYVTVIPEFAFDLAVTDVDRADTLIARYGEGKQVVIAGHSLGGAMAAQYASDREKAGSALAGLVLMAAYPAESADLSSASLPVLSLVGENDQVVDAAALEAGWGLLPADTQRVVVDGSVHAFFGRYGAQSGDGAPSVPRVAAETRISQAIEEFLAAV